MLKHNYTIIAGTMVAGALMLASATATAQTSSFEQIASNTVWKYLTKPITKTFTESLGER